MESTRWLNSTDCRYKVWHGNIQIMINKPSKTISASATLIDNIPKTVLLGTVVTCGLITNDISDSLVCVTYD